MRACVGSRFVTKRITVCRNNRLRTAPRPQQQLPFTPLRSFSPYARPPVVACSRARFACSSSAATCSTFRGRATCPQHRLSEKSLAAGIGQWDYRV